MVVSGAAASVARTSSIVRSSAGKQNGEGEDAASAGPERLHIIPPGDQLLIDVIISKRVSRYGSGRVGRGEVVHASRGEVVHSLACPLTPPGV
jgi:hypothetical protein